MTNSPTMEVSLFTRRQEHEWLVRRKYVWGWNPPRNRQARPRFDRGSAAQHELPEEARLVWNPRRIYRKAQQQKRHARAMSCRKTPAKEAKTQNRNVAKMRATKHPFQTKEVQAAVRQAQKELNEQARQRTRCGVRGVGPNERKPQRAKTVVTPRGRYHRRCTLATIWLFCTATISAYSHRCLRPIITPVLPALQRSKYINKRCNGRDTLGSRDGRSSFFSRGRLVI